MYLRREECENDDEWKVRHRRLDGNQVLAKQLKGWKLRAAHICVLLLSFTRQSLGTSLPAAGIDHVYAASELPKVLVHPALYAATITLSCNAD